MPRGDEIGQNCQGCRFQYCFILPFFEKRVNSLRQICQMITGKRRIWRKIFAKSAIFGRLAL